MTGEHEGVYYPLTGMSKEIQQQLIDDHFLFKVGSNVATFVVKLSISERHCLVVELLEFVL